MNHYRVVHIRGLGYGYITPGDWATYSARRKSRVRVLAMFDTELEARKAHSTLPQEWVNESGLYYRGGKWWQSLGRVTIHTGQEVELSIPYQ